MKNTQVLFCSSAAAVEALPARHNLLPLLSTFFPVLYCAAAEIWCAATSDSISAHMLPLTAGLPQGCNCFRSSSRSTSALSSAEASTGLLPSSAPAVTAGPEQYFPSKILQPEASLAKTFRSSVAKVKPSKRQHADRCVSQFLCFFRNTSSSSSSSSNSWYTGVGAGVCSA